MDRFFIIDRTDDPILSGAILKVAEIREGSVVLEYAADGEKRCVEANLGDGEFYDDSVKARRNKELMVRNVKDLMARHGILLEDLK